MSSQQVLGQRHPPAKQIFHRLAGTWTYWGWKGGYFDGEEDARAFMDEQAYMLATQKVAPNSPAPRSRWAGTPPTGWSTGCSSRRCSGS